jgi:hypothetical protein
MAGLVRIPACESGFRVIINGQLPSARIVVTARSVLVSKADGARVLTVPETGVVSSDTSDPEIRGPLESRGIEFKTCA